MKPSKPQIILSSLSALEITTRRCKGSARVKYKTDNTSPFLCLYEKTCKAYPHKLLLLQTVETSTSSLKECTQDQETTWDQQMYPQVAPVIISRAIIVQVHCQKNNCTIISHSH
ncbi:hypothetical protein PGT21_010050 [Puccinia graminis f. sp. tritici]|uniref:Uncharacterized protein n=1 Tax=Puccinia graminis f. sp. tritici TaxID=56615 RepID=A0A5B0P222_PUCGR|nr:hypothetical protein PGTUg99_032502 [Puccinia graminis f. sp. tritici]KAA1094109.1 hypothetical protein PGT21_010050 [Puccinia graminis f. sp. tritici]